MFYLLQQHTQNHGKRFTKERTFQNLKKRKNPIQKNHSIMRNKFMEYSVTI